MLKLMTVRTIMKKYLKMQSKAGGMVGSLFTGMYCASKKTKVWIRRTHISLR